MSGVDVVVRLWATVWVPPAACLASAVALRQSKAAPSRPSLGCPLCSSIRRIRLIRILIRPGCRKDRVIGMRGAIVRLAGAQSRLRGLQFLFRPGPHHWLGTQEKQAGHGRWSWPIGRQPLAFCSSRGSRSKASQQATCSSRAGVFRRGSNGRPHHSCPAKTLDLSISSRLPFFQKPGTIHHLPRDIGVQGW
jgi:hypothetical protein